jgi:regulator of sigma E protease
MDGLGTSMFETFISNLLAFVVVVGVMIIFHELGHFLAAKFFGVRVEAFALGFGNRLFGVKYGDTDYRVNALPLGGYVKMSGETVSDSLTGEPWEFQSKPRWQRFIIALMGPAFNFLLAVVLLTGLFMYRYQKLAYQEKPASIGYVQKDSPAAKAGLQPGDLIVRFDSIDSPDWETVELRVLSSPDHAVELSYRRAGQVRSTTVTPAAEGPSRIGVAGWAPYLPAIIKRVEPQMPAARAGIQAGEQIVRVNDIEILFRPQMTDLVQKSKGGPLKLTVRHRDQDREVTVAALQKDTPGVGQMWRIGVEFQDEMITKQLAFPEALRVSLDTNRKYALLIFEFVGKLFERKMSPRSFEGPLGISRLAGEAARQGLPELVMFMAAISLNLGIFNLFPIPIMDGGVMLLLVVESAMRRDLSLVVKERIVQVGFVFLVLFAVYVTYMDIIKALPPRFERMLP